MIYTTGMTKTQTAQIRKNEAKERQNRVQTVLETLKGYVGKTGQLELEGMTFEVMVYDAKRVYGHDHVLVSPRQGEGTKWVRAARLLELA
jgi:hypothetical protein